jgi:hypothetical protein
VGEYEKVGRRFEDRSTKGDQDLPKLDSKGDKEERGGRGHGFEDRSTKGEQNLLKIDSDRDEEEEEVDIKC